MAKNINLLNISGECKNTPLGSQTWRFVETLWNLVIVQFLI